MHAATAVAGASRSAHKNRTCSCLLVQVPWYQVGSVVLLQVLLYSRTYCSEGRRRSTLRTLARPRARCARLCCARGGSLHARLPVPPSPSSACDVRASGAWDSPPRSVHTTELALSTCEASRSSEWSTMVIDDHAQATAVTAPVSTAMFELPTYAMADSCTLHAALAIRQSATVTHGC